MSKPKPDWDLAGIPHCPVCGSTRFEAGGWEEVFRMWDGASQQWVDSDLEPGLTKRSHVLICGNPDCGLELSMTRKFLANLGE